MPLSIMGILAETSGMRNIDSFETTQSLQLIADLLVHAEHEQNEMRNRRENQRLPYSTPVKMGVVDENGKFVVVAEVYSTDVSQGGFGLWSKMEFKPGTTYWLELRGRVK